MNTPGIGAFKCQGFTLNNLRLRSIKGKHIGNALGGDKPTLSQGSELDCRQVACPGPGQSITRRDPITKGLPWDLCLPHHRT